MRTILLILLCLNVASASGVEFVCRLSPAGSFTATTKAVSGFAKKVGSKIVAENVLVKLDNLDTGIELRNKHLKDRLEVGKFPNALLVKAEGENGKGRGKIKIKNIEKDIAGDYEVKGNVLKARFPLLISDFGITGVKYLGVGVKDEIQVKVEIPFRQK